MENLSNQRMQTQRFKCVVKWFQINLFFMKDKLLNVFSSSTKVNTLTIYDEKIRDETLMENV
jgi:hypothetical protein